MLRVSCRLRVVTSTLFKILISIEGSSVKWGDKFSVNKWLVMWLNNAFVKLNVKYTFHILLLLLRLAAFEKTVKNERATIHVLKCQRSHVV